MGSAVQPDIVRHLHDLTKLSEQALNSPDFIQLAVDTIDRDKDRAEMLAGLSISEKLSKVLNILDTDPEYPKEYERFVNSMSYAQDETVPTYKQALEKVRLIVSSIN